MKEHTQKLSHAATIIGLTAVGAVIATIVRLQMTAVVEVGKASISLQEDLFNPIVPKLLLWCSPWWCSPLTKKGYRH